MASDQPLRLTGIEALADFAQSPFAVEDASPPTPAIIVDVGAQATDLSPDAVAAVRLLPIPIIAVATSALARAESVRAVTDIVLCESSTPASERADTRIDVRVDDVEQALDELADKIRASGAAAHTLTLLLRNGTSSRADGLMLESLAYSTLMSGATYRRWLAGRTPTPVEHGDEPVVVTATDDELVIELNRPDRHNAFNAAMRDGLVDALRVGAADARRTITISGRGPSFCSGGDLDEFGTTPDLAAAHLIRMTRSPARLISQLAERTTVHLHGSCYGAGIELPAFAGTLIAHPKTRFCLPEVGFGLVPGAGGTISVPRRIGRHRTLWWAISGAAIDTAVASAWGLIDEIRTDH